jgi:hypothetical protein
MEGERESLDCLLSRREGEESRKTIQDRKGSRDMTKQAPQKVILAQTFGDHIIRLDLTYCVPIPSDFAYESRLRSRPTE